MVNGDPVAAAALLASTDISVVGYETAERVLSFVHDRGFVLPDPTLVTVAAAILPEARYVKAQLDRARGVAHRDEAALRSALEFFDGAGARPAAARVRVELGRLIGDNAMADAGMSALLKIGDIDQHDRYSAARKG